MNKWVFVNYETGEIMQVSEPVYLFEAIELIGHERYINEELVIYPNMESIKTYKEYMEGK